jgi:hypothetical protein
MIMKTKVAIVHVLDGLLYLRHPLARVECGALDFEQAARTRRLSRRLLL